MATLNIGMKVNRSISGATTVNPNAIAVVTYNLTGVPSPNLGVSIGFGVQQDVIRTYGPGQAIPSSFSAPIVFANNAGIVSTVSVTYSLVSGFELINTI